MFNLMHYGRLYSRVKWLEYAETKDTFEPCSDGWSTKKPSGRGGCMESGKERLTFGIMQYQVWGWKQNLF